jgi:5-formyltetrahydrofolate cyclo-ligase
MSSASSPPVPTLHEAKQSLRERVLALRDAIPPAVRVAASQAIAARVEALPAFIAARTVLLTLPFRSEWDTWPLAHRIAASHRRLVVPRVDRATRMLALHHVEDLLEVVPGYLGIPEPRPDCPAIDPADVDFVLIPGVAFDAAGRRLGYGGGYYDRLLPLMRPDVAEVGAAFDEQIVAAVPVAAHDRRVGTVVTPTRTIVADLR